MMKPSVRQMLEIGKDCGLETLGQAYQNYMGHYDCFFLISDYEAQYTEFVEEVKSVGLVTKNEIWTTESDIAVPKWILLPISIDEALKML